MSAAYGLFLLGMAARTLLVLACLILGLRLFGKREIGQMNVYDLALVLLLANAVQNAMTRGSGNLTVGLVCATSLVAAGSAASALFVRVPTLEARVVGAPTIIVHEGSLIRDAMRREGVTEDEVDTAIRQHGLRQVSEVRLGVLEVDGSISIVPISAG